MLSILPPLGPPMRLYHLLPSALALLGAACARQQPAPEPVTQASEQSESRFGTGVIRWTGNLQPVQTRSGYANTPAVRTKASGTVVLQTDLSMRGLSRAEIVFSYPVSEASLFRWAVLPGRCGSPTLPLVGYESYPLIEMRTNGQGRLSAEVAVPLDRVSQLHVNIYDGGIQLDNVIACANLRPE